MPRKKKEANTAKPENAVVAGAVIKTAPGMPEFNAEEATLALLYRIVGALDKISVAEASELGLLAPYAEAKLFLSRKERESE